MNEIKKKLNILLHLIFLGVIVFIAIAILSKIIFFILPQEYQNIIKLFSNDLGNNREQLKIYIISFENSKVIFVGLQILQVIFAPIPGQLSGILGGYVFGFWEGLLLTTIGLAIGSFIAMLLGRVFGVKIINKFVPKRILNKYDYLLSNESLNTFFIIFLLPFFPDDAICFVAGLTRIKLWKLMLVSVLGRLPGMAVFSYMGTTIDKNLTLTIIVFSVAVLISTLYWLFNKQINKKLTRILNLIKIK